MSDHFRKRFVPLLAAGLLALAGPHGTASAQARAGAAQTAADASAPLPDAEPRHAAPAAVEPARMPAAEPAQDLPMESATPPTERTVLDLARLAQGNKFVLSGLANTQYLEFTVRKDREVTQARLDLEFTPSPSLLDKLSHIRVYLNDELMGVAALEAGSPGKRQRRSLALDPLMITSFNRIRLEFVGHYTDICEDLANSALWLDLGRSTRVVLDQQTVPVANDLAFFPEPFMDAGDMQPQTIPFVFAQAPDQTGLQAAGVLASYFGSKAGWRSLHLPVVYDELPAGNAIVFADNANRPGFLRNYPKVEAPTVDMISAPDNPRQKLLLVLGRDADDLLTAARALATGSPLFRGASARIDEYATLAPRRPYDAPRWTPTDRPVPFSELVDYLGQLEASGLRPAPIQLNLNLPPDLFVWRNNGIPLRLRYRYTPPSVRDESRLNLSLNNQFIDSYPLLPSDAHKGQLLTRLPLLEDNAAAASENLIVPALKIGANNQIRFDFSFASTLGSAQKDQCQTTMPVDMRASIDQSSTIDFSGYLHYLQMPNLSAFAASGFPFSRMADLSETIIVVPQTLRQDQAATVLEILSHIGAQVGFPALKVRIMDDWSKAAGEDADILWVGEPTAQAQARPDGNLILEGARASLRQARNPLRARQAAQEKVRHAKGDAADAVERVEVVAHAPLAAIVQMQSESFAQRSWVGLLASSPEDFTLLRDAIADPGKREAMAGSVILIRSSGVHSAAVGPHYYVGHLHWWQWLWYHLSDKPLLLAVIAVATILLITILLWMALRGVARRRLDRNA